MLNSFDNTLNQKQWFRDNFVLKEDIEYYYEIAQ